MKCPKCQGWIVKEKYICDHGGCVYLKCIHCGKVWFFRKKKVQDPDDIAIPSVADVVKEGVRMTFERIALELNTSVQAVHQCYQRALSKIMRHPSYKEMAEKWKR